MSLQMIKDWNLIPGVMTEAQNVHNFSKTLPTYQESVHILRIETVLYVKSIDCKEFAIMRGQSSMSLSHNNFETA